MCSNSLARQFSYLFHAKYLLPSLDKLLPVRSCLQNFYQCTHILWEGHIIQKISPVFLRVRAQSFHVTNPPPLNNISLGLNGTKRKGCVHFCNKAQLTFRSSSVSHWCVHMGAFKNCWQGADTVKCRKYGPIKIWNLSYFFHFTNFLLPFWKGPTSVS